MLRILHPRLHLGTSSWSTRSWDGVFYPVGMPPRDYLAYYAGVYRTVEVDSTWYHIPSLSTVRRWRTILPEGFRMAAKFPRVITHEKTLAGCEPELEEFLETIRGLGDRLGPLLLQFPYFAATHTIGEREFLRRVETFLPRLPGELHYAVEVRNRRWLRAPLLELLRHHGVALALIDHPWMPRIDHLMQELDPLTGGFSYMRWLGDRHAIERMTTSWDRTVIDREEELRRWMPVVEELLGRGAEVFGYFNNHYAGHAPGSIALFERLWSGGSSGVQDQDAAHHRDGAAGDGD